MLEPVVWREWNKRLPLLGGHTVQRYSLWVGAVDGLAIGWNSVQRSRCPVFKIEEAQARVHRVHVEHGPVPCAFVQCTNCATVRGSPAQRPQYQQKEVGSVCFRWVLHPCSHHSSLAVCRSVTTGPFLVPAYFGCCGAQPRRDLEECSDRSRSRCQGSTEEVPVEVPARLCSSRIGS